MWLDGWSLHLWDYVDQPSGVEVERESNTKWKWEKRNREQNWRKTWTRKKDRGLRWCKPQNDACAAFFEDLNISDETVGDIWKPESDIGKLPKRRLHSHFWRAYLVACKSSTSPHNVCNPGQEMPEKTHKKLMKDFSVLWGAVVPFAFNSLDPVLMEQSNDAQTDACAWEHISCFCCHGTLLVYPWETAGGNRTDTNNLNCTEKSLWMYL